jgi:hypothetical protein
VHVEDEDLTGIEPARPEIPPIIGEIGVMGLVAATHRDRVDHLSVGRRALARVDGHELVRAVAEALDTEGPDVDEFLLPGDLGHVRGLAGLVRPHRVRSPREADEHRQRGEKPGATDSPYGLHA